MTSFDISSAGGLRVLGVFAHPDDETFCAGGTFARYAAAGAEIKVISATQGDAGQIRDAKAATRRTLGTVRAEELARACAELGVQHVECWNYGDGTLKQVDQRQLIGDVVRAVRQFRPHVVISFGPDGGYGHPDHIAISHATTEACRLSGREDQFPEQGLAVHEPRRVYHAYFPQSRLLFSERLVKWLVSLGQRFAGTTDFVHALLLLSEESSMLHFTSDHVEINWFPAGFFIVEQGEPSSKLYLILSGEAEVFREYEDGSQEKLADLGAGVFFGEEGLAHDRPRNAHVIASSPVTCLTFSPEEPTNFAGRGDTAQLTGRQSKASGVTDPERATTCITVTDFVEHKVRALSQHRTQFPIQPDMFPLELLQEIFGQEYFVRVMPSRVLEDELI